MYLKSGLIVLALGGALTYSLVFTTFDQPIRSWTVTETGDVVRDTIACPTPWKVFFADVAVDLRPWEWQYCIRSARTLLTEGIFVAAIAAWLGLTGVIRGRKPPPRPLIPISEIFDIPTEPSPAQDRD